MLWVWSLSAGFGFNRNCNIVTSSGTFPHCHLESDLQEELQCVHAVRYGCLILTLGPVGITTKNCSFPSGYFI